MSNKTQFCTLILHDERFGIPVERVQEVIRTLDVSPIALAPRVVKGLANLRGQIVVAIDLKKRLRISPDCAAGPTMNVVVRTDHDPISLVVDDVGEVVELDRDRCHPVPSTLRGDTANLLTGVYRLSNSLLMLLDLDKVLDIHEVQRQGIPATHSQNPPVPSEKTSNA